MKIRHVEITWPAENTTQFISRKALTIRLNMFVETALHFSGIFDEQKVQKNKRYLKWKSFVKL